MRYCVGDGYGLVAGLGCDGSKGSSCFCAEHLRPDASSYLSSCLNSAYSTCHGSSDYGVATAVYDDYCHFTAPATVTAIAAPSAASPGGSVNNQPVTVTVTSTPLATAPARSTATPLLSISKLLLAAALISAACA